MIEQSHDSPLVIKRYARSHLYDPAAGRYRTVEDLRRLAARGVALTVLDSETGEDVTRVLLA